MPPRKILKSTCSETASGGFWWLLRLLLPIHKILRIIIIWLSVERLGESKAVLEVLLAGRADSLPSWSFSVSDPEESELS